MAHDKPHLRRQTQNAKLKVQPKPCRACPCDVLGHRCHPPSLNEIERLLRNLKSDRIDDQDLEAQSFLNIIKLQAIVSVKCHLTHDLFFDFPRRIFAVQTVILCGEKSGIQSLMHTRTCSAIIDYASTPNPVCQNAFDCARCVHMAPYSRPSPALGIHQLALMGDILFGLLAS
ncbi:hypothetical protein N7G274_005059 [Stereocaulon virgatum]|uniref:Uncharacterized protein n=1 Tax=Stereocaulon virgatum TaxID=373712 RepID=A0ABR4AAQ8_9LECA